MTELSEFSLVSNPYQTSEAYGFLSQYGKIETFTGPHDSLITLLPTCTTDPSHLISANWNIPIHVGNCRYVKHIQALNDGTKTGLFIKSPERDFTQSPMYLKKGEVWWGGTRSGERRIRLLTNPIVEEQTLWEAAILLELLAHNILAEVPQAVLQNNRGDCSLVVQEIPTTAQNVHFPESELHRLTQHIKESTSLVPVDFSRHNCLVDLQGNPHIIDVNRWLWIPHTDDYRKTLLNEIKNGIYHMFQ